MSRPVWDKQAFEEKYEAYSMMLYRVAYQYLMNTAAAEDIVQESFIKLLLHGQPFNDTEHEKAWLLRVTVNACKNYLKAKGNNHIAYNEALELYDNSFDENSAVRLDVERELQKLTNEQRLLMYLYYYERYSVGEISSITGRKVNTVKSDLKRARDKLKEQWERE